MIYGCIYHFQIINTNMNHYTYIQVQALYTYIPLNIFDFNFILYIKFLQNLFET